MRQFRSFGWALVLTALCGTTALAQRQVSGTVKASDTGEPVPSAQVLIPGTSIGALTGDDGRFTLNNAPSGTFSLEVRRIGFQQTTVTIAADRSTIDVQLTRGVLRLGEQVVTGQATTVARQNLANDVATVHAEDLTRTSQPTLENALQGKVAGATITANSGAPGGGMQIRMRGATSIFGNAEPLYVIDGVPVSNATIQSGVNAISSASAGMDASDQDNGSNRIADINPADIASIEILKGPSAAAIYGSSAANGVVLITTKRGQPGATVLHLTQRFGTYRPSNKIGFRHFTLEEAYDVANSGDPTKEILDSAAVKANWESCNGYCDMEDQVFDNTGLAYLTSLSASGGDENTRFFASGLVQHDNGIMRGTGYDKQSMRLNGEQKVGSKLTLRVQTNLVHSLTKRGLSNNDNNNITPYFAIGQTPSFFDFRPKDGVYPDNPFTSSNVLQTVAFLDVPSDVFRLIGSTNAKYDVFSTDRQSLTATLDAGIDHYTQKDHLYSPPFMQYEGNDGLLGTVTDQSGVVTNGTVALTVAHKFTPESNSFSATTSLGVRSGYQALNRTNIVGQGLLPGQTSVDQASATSTFQARQDVRNLALFLGEDFLALDERLFVSLGALGQRTTTNADVNKLYYYPKASASYRLPSFASWINELKVRVAYGETGNEPFYGNKYTPLATVNYGGATGVQIGGIVADPDLHPEREKEFEGGIDAGLFNSRVSLSATFYQKNNEDLLLQEALPPSSGYATRIFNAGSSRNRGMELGLTALPVASDELTWTSRVTFTKNVGVITSLPDSSGFSVGAFSNDFGNGFIEVGASPTQIVGTDVDVDRGFRKYGDTEPDFSVGFSNDFVVGPVRLYGLLDWRHGSSVVNLSQLIYDLSGTSADVDAADARLADLGVKAPYIQDAGFVKLREVTLSYDLPESLVRGILGDRADRVSLQLSGRNLVTWTDYEGLDPEVSNFGNQNIIRSQDVAPYPPSRSFFVSLDVDF